MPSCVCLGGLAVDMETTSEQESARADIKRGGIPKDTFYFYQGTHCLYVMKLIIILNIFPR